MGYCRRGIVELVEGKTPDDALTIIERTCSLAHEAHRIAFCQAMEAATNTQISASAQSIRVVFAEIERILARLWTLALASRAAMATQLYHLALEQRESLFAALEGATGERHYWGIAVPGGIREDLELQPLQETLNFLEQGLAGWKTVVAPTGQLGRSGLRIGVIPPEQAQSMSLTGLAARGSIHVSDLRVTQPYARYGDYQTELSGGSNDEETTEDANIQHTGDVQARLACAASDISKSYAIVQAALKELLEAANKTETNKIVAPSGEISASSSVEGPHGPVSIRFGYTNSGVVSGLVLQAPGAGVVEVLPQLLGGRLLPQIPMILASLDLCTECVDQ